MNKERHLDDNLNPLGIKTIPKLLVQFAIPSIIAMVVTAVYNVVGLNLRPDSKRNKIRRLSLRVVSFFTFMNIGFIKLYFRWDLKTF